MQVFTADDNSGAYGLYNAKISGLTGHLFAKRSSLGAHPPCNQIQKMFRPKQPPKPEIPIFCAAGRFLASGGPENLYKSPDTSLPVTRKLRSQEGESSNTFFMVQVAQRHSVSTDPEVDPQLATKTKLWLKHLLDGEWSESKIPSPSKSINRSKVRWDPNNISLVKTSVDRYRT